MEIAELIIRWDPLSDLNVKWKRILQRRMALGKVCLDAGGLPPPNEKRDLFYIVVKNCGNVDPLAVALFNYIASPFVFVIDDVQVRHFRHHTNAYLGIKDPLKLLHVALAMPSWVEGRRWLTLIPMSNFCGDQER